MLRFRAFGLLTFFFFLATVFNQALAQGSWQPGGADLNYPRTLFKASEIPAVRLSLQEPARQNLYTNVYGSAVSTPPADNTTTENRRLRARAAKNAAFIRIMNLKPNAASGFDSLTASEKLQLQTTVISLLENTNTQVSSFFTYEQWQWRSKELIDYLTAYDLLRGAGVSAATLQPSQVKLQQFAGNLYSAGSNYVGLINNNHLFMTAAALGMAGVVLNDAGSTTVAQQPQSWINISMYNLDNAMWRNAARQSEPGAGNIAGYAEGPYYFKYAMLNCLPFFRAFGNFLPAGDYSFTWNSNTRQIANPYYDPNYDLLYQWITEITMPDGRIPALEDSYIDMAMPEMALTGKPQFVKAFHGQNLDPLQLTSLNAQLDGTVDLRVNYLAANVNSASTSPLPLTAFPKSGNLIFRSGEGFTGNYLHVYGKNGKSLSNSGGHNHGDAGSFLLYAKGQLLALDAGYLNFSRRAEVGNASNHNLVLVDGAGPLIGTSGAANDAEAFIENTFETTQATYGEVRTAYNGTAITRKTLSVRGEYFLMADFISAAANHTYTWQLHGFGLENGSALQGTFTDNLTAGEGTWQKNGVSLRAHVTAKDGVSNFPKANNFHETTYNFAETHTTFLAQKHTVSETQFLATLYPFTTAAQTTTTLLLPNLAASITESPNFTDLAFTQSDTVLQLVNTPQLSESVSSDSRFTFFSKDNQGMVRQAFLQDGTTLFVGSTQLLKSTRRANILLAEPVDGQFEGYSSKATTLEYKTATAPTAVSGQNLSSWSYNSTTQLLTLSLAGPSNFDFKINQTPLPVTLVAFKAEKRNRQVKLTWQTASEIDNLAFDLQVSADGKTWKTIATKAGQGTTTHATFYEHLHTPDFSGQIYYRLAQHDLDGSITFSGIKTLYFENYAEARINVYPNPAADFFWLELDNNSTEKASLNFYNTSGKVMHQQEIALKTGLNKLKITLPETLPAGLYQIQLMAAQPRPTFRLQKHR